MTELSFLIVNTEQREALLRGLDAVAAERARLPFACEVLVLDNASTDGSAEAARAHPAVDAVLALEERRGKGENDSALLQRAAGRFGLLLNEDAELEPGATAALHAALEARPDAGAAGAQLLRPGGAPVPSAWRFPTPRAALAQALFLHPWLVVQSRGHAVREVDWAQSSAMLVRTAAARSIGWFDPAFFVYSDEVDFCRRLRDAGWAVLWVPHARAVHHEGLTSDRVPARRIVEFARNRDRYVRKHEGRAAALAVRLLVAWAYLVRAAAALAVPGHDARRYLAHVAATLRPSRGEGLREAAARFNGGGR